MSKLELYIAGNIEVVTAKQPQAIELPSEIGAVT